MEVIGGGLAIPIYSFTRPYSDYFNSNAMQNFLITADVSAPTLVLTASRFMMSEQGSRRPMPDENEIPVFILF